MKSYPVMAAGIQTRVLEAGQRGTPVIFLHGVGARADRFECNLEAFARAGYHCFALDLPGHGFADKHAGLNFELDAMASFLSQALRELAVSMPAAWVGTSYGGLLASAMLQRDSSRVRALVLVGSMGLAPLPITAASSGLGVSAFMKAEFFFGVSACVMAFLSSKARQHTCSHAPAPVAGSAGVHSAHQGQVRMPQCCRALASTWRPVAGAPGD